MFLTISLLALLQAAPAPPAGCTVVDSENGASHFDCGDGVTAAMRDLVESPDGAPDFSARQLLDDLEKAARERDPLRYERTRGRVGGQDAEVLRAEYPGERITFVGLERREGVRWLWCEEPTDGRCTAVLEALAARPWESLPLRKVEVLGRTLEVPFTCRPERRDASGNLQCRSGTLYWAQVPDETRASELSADFGRHEDPAEQARRETLPCHVSGAPASCLRVRYSRRGQAATDLVARVKLASGWHVVACSVTHATGETIPCSFAFELR